MRCSCCRCNFPSVSSGSFAAIEERNTIRLHSFPWAICRRSTRASSVNPRFMRKMLDMNGMQVFAEVAKESSFTTAARTLGLPKSTVSRCIGDLEHRLGVRLLERTTRNVRLTDAGEIYLERCRRMLDEAEEADLIM